MGGVLRTQKALKIFKGGQQDPQKVFWNGDLKWDKPIPGIYPIKEMSQTDNILFVGSSDIGGLMVNNWGPRSHDWPNVFRNNYTGTMFSQIEGRDRYGMRAAYTYGRVSLSQVVENAQNGGYGDANPLTHMGDFNALCVDTSDIMLPTLNNDFPNIPDYYNIRQMPLPYQWDFNRGGQLWLNEELEARMVLIREARSQGIDKFYFTVPWPRLPIDNHWASEAELETWINTKFQNFEDSIHYQQDRLIFQMEFEQLGGHVNIIPFHLMVKQTYEDWASDNLPFALTSIQNLWANHDPLSEVDPVTGSLPRHWYMLNHYGTYAMNALWAACVYGVDPRGYPATDGYFTLPSEAATYFQNLAWDLAHTYARAGRTREYTGYVMPKIRNWTPEEILEDNLIMHFEGAMVAGQNQAITPATITPHAMYVIDVDTTVLDDSDGNYSFGLRGGGIDGVYVTIVNNPSNNNGVTVIKVAADQAGRVEQFIGVATESGTNIRLFLDCVYPYPDLVQKWGDNLSGQIFYPTVDWKESGYSFGSGSTYNTKNPLNNRLSVIHDGVTIREAIVSNILIPDDKRFNLYRYLSRKYQVNLWEPLWPDMET